MAADCQGSRFAKNSAQKVFGRLFQKVVDSKGKAFGRVPPDAKSFAFIKDQEGRRNSPVGCCVVGNPIKGFPDAASHAAFGQLAICQPVFRHAAAISLWR